MSSSKDDDLSLIDATLEIINLLESGKVENEERAEQLLEVLVVKCARWYDFTLKDNGDDFFAQALKRLFDGVLRKWVLKPNWLKCPRDDRYAPATTSGARGGIPGDETDACTREERSKLSCSSSGNDDEEFSAYARPGLLLNVLQLIRLFTRDGTYRKKLVCDQANTGCLVIITHFLACRTRAHFEEKWLLPSGNREAMATPLGREMLVECVSIIRRLATDPLHCEALFLAHLVAPHRSVGNESNDQAPSDQIQTEFGIAGTLALLLHTVDNAILPLAIDSLTHIVAAMNKHIDDFEWSTSAKGPRLSAEDKEALVDTVHHVACCGMEVVLKMIESYSRPFDRLAATLLTTLLSLREVRTKVFGNQNRSGSGLGYKAKARKNRMGVEPVGGSLLIQRLVSKFSYCERELHIPILNALSVVLQENLFISDLRDVGGIPIILNAIRAPEAAKEEGGQGKWDTQTEMPLEQRRERALASMDVVCAIAKCIKVISIDDEASYHVKQCNGVYLLGRCLVQPWNPTDPQFFQEFKSKSGASALYDGVDPSRVHHARAHVLRAMRYIFSSERNRDVFKKLMSPEFFSAFIDVGHYQESLKPYLKLAEAMYVNDEGGGNAGLGGGGAGQGPTQEKDAKGGVAGSGMVGNQSHTQGPKISYWTRAALKEIDKNFQTDALKTVNGYQFVELLGKGAFGSVYKARKKGIHEEKTCAVKELALEDVHIFGATEQEQEEAKAAISQEMKILAEMDHPGIVHYYESFERDRKVYIAMEYAGGMSLADRITSLEARNQRSSEAEVWQILTQLCLALRYMHQDKEIVHRDLTPANIIISLGHDIVTTTLDDDASSQPITVRITDFGYAKRKEKGGFVMRSLVGTITFCCPEIVQHQVYTDKADVWSLGCILYNVMLLKPPFAASNIFNIAQKIVEGQFDPPIESKTEVPWYSDDLKGLVGRMLTVDPDKRPSIGEVMVNISSRIARETDSMRTKIRLLEEEIHMERKYFVREKRIAMKTRNALDRANSASSISSIIDGWSEGSAQGQGSSRPTHGANGASITANPSGPNGSPLAFGDLESPKLVPFSQSVAAAAAAGSIPLQTTLSNLSNASVKSLTGSTATKISIPQRNLRVLTDPVVDMLTQVHKLMLVAQLPPSLDLHSDERRQFLQRVHGCLFAPDQRAGAIKAHLAKLIEQSDEAIEGLGLSIHGIHGKEATISYAHVYAMLEDVLKETGFYLDTSTVTPRYSDHA